MIRVGVAGWDYPDWAGVVYPAAVGRGFDRLAWIARFVDVIEVNSSFYRPVVPRTADSWVARTAGFADFRFTAKTHRSWTHEPDADLERAVPETLSGLRPLHEAERLGALLVQFPQSFHYTTEATDRIERLVERTEGWPVSVEVRHASWEAEEATDRLRDLGAGWCAVDQPSVGRSVARVLPRVTGPVGYLRLHGRNTADWFRPDAGRDARYDYLYSKGELGELAGPVREMASATAEMYVIQNNHFRGQALANALQMKRLVGDAPPEAPEELVAAYPALEPDVRVQRRRLF